MCVCGVCHHFIQCDVFSLVEAIKLSLRQREQRFVESCVILMFIINFIRQLGSEMEHTSFLIVLRDGDREDIGIITYPQPETLREVILNGSRC